MSRCASGFFIIVVLLGFAWIPIVKAQEANPQPTAFLYPPELTAFPHIQAYLDVRDRSGKLIHKLQPQSVRVFEDGKQITDLVLEEIRPGIHAAIVLSPGPPFGVQNSQGVSRYDGLITALKEWLHSKQGSTLDDWSL